MQVVGQVTVQEWSANRASTEDKYLSRMCVFSSETERRRVLVMELVNISVKRTIVERLVCWK